MFDVGDLAGGTAGPAFEAAVTRVQEELGEIAGVWHAAAGRLVSLAAQALRLELWAVQGVHSPEQWLGWQCGISSGRARQIVSIAKRADELPVCMAALEAGEVSLDSAAVIARGVPAWADEAVTDLAKLATVRQLSRVVNGYSFDPDPRSDPDGKVRRRMSFGPVDEDRWRMLVETTVDEGAAIEAALVAFREQLFQARQQERGDAADAVGEGGSGDTSRAGVETDGGAGAAGATLPDGASADAAGSDGLHRSAADISWVDALMELIEQAAASDAEARPHSDRAKVLFHYECDRAGRPVMAPHQLPPLPAALRRLLTCDATVAPVWQVDGAPVSVGRSHHIVPRRTRRLLEHRDGGCRVPGCTATRWVQVHHIVHWEDGGPTDTANLVCLCPHHHRLHHRGLLSITGNADRPGGLTFTDQHGKPLRGASRARPPGEPPGAAARRHAITPSAWQPPLGERIDHACVWFGHPPHASSSDAGSPANGNAAEHSDADEIVASGSSSNPSGPTAHRHPSAHRPPGTTPRIGGTTSGCGDPPAA